jgi:hypothetical protein
MLMLGKRSEMRREHSTYTIFIQSADVAGAKRLQHQRTLPICASGGGDARATRTNGMLPMRNTQNILRAVERLMLHINLSISLHNKSIEWEPFFMSRRSRKYRKRFQCGHQGFGLFCHCCAERKRMRALAQVQQKKRKSLVAAQQHRVCSETKKDAMGLYKLPHAIARKARSILEKITDGTVYWKLGGKRLSGERQLIRIPIGRRYRLLCREEANQITPLKVLSHEDYNPWVRRKQGLLARLFSSGSGDR